MPASPGSDGLSTFEAQALLESRFELERQRRDADLSHTEAHLRAALHELELLRGEEAARLGTRAARLQREHEAAMAALERRFLSDAEALQARLKEGLLQETAASQAAIDARARELLGAVGAAGAVHPSAAPSLPPRSPARPQLATSVGVGIGAPARSSPAPPPPAVAAATEAIAALRLALPPSPAKLQLRSAAGAKPTASPSPSLKPPALTVRFAAPPSGPSADGGERCGRGGGPGAPLAAAAAVPHHLQHESNSEWEDDSYLGGSSSDAEGAATLASRAPPVKLVNPGGMMLASSPRSPSFAAALPASSGSGGKPGVHLNLLPRSPSATASAGADSPRLRAYSPCTCRTGSAAAAAALSPRAAAVAGARSGCCGLARAYTSD